MNKTTKLATIIIMFLMTLISVSTAHAATLNKPKSFRVDSISEHKITVSWKEVPKAKGYYLYWQNTKSGKSEKITVKSKTPTYEIDHLKANTTYKLSVQAYKNKTTSPKSKTLKVTTILLKPKQPNGDFYLVNDRKLKITWDKAQYATAYELRIRNGGKLVKRVVTDKNKYNFTNFDPKAQYKIAVRSIREKNHSRAYSSFWVTHVTPNAKAIADDLLDDIYIGNPYEEPGLPNLTYNAKHLEAFANYGNNGQEYSSRTDYLLWCNRISYHICVFVKKNDKWKTLYYWPCIIGRNSSPTRAGTYTLSRAFETHQYDQNYAKYGTSYDGDNAIHSLLYPSQTDSLTLGYQASYGCIRLVSWQAKFIYDNCEDSTLIIR